MTAASWSFVVLKPPSRRTAKPLRDDSRRLVDVLRRERELHQRRKGHRDPMLAVSWTMRSRPSIFRNTAAQMTRPKMGALTRHRTAAGSSAQ